MEQATVTFKEEFLYQKNADDDFCIELYQYAVSAIQKTKVIPDIKIRSSRNLINISKNPKNCFIETIKLICWSTKNWILVLFQI